MRAAARVASRYMASRVASRHLARITPEKLRANYVNMGDFGGTNRILDSWVLEVEGPTFDVKDQLKALGLRWNQDHKKWGIWANDYAYPKITKYEARKQGYRDYEDMREAQKRAWPKVQELVREYNVKVQEKQNELGGSPNPRESFKDWMLWLKRFQRMTDRLGEYGLKIEHTHPSRYSNEEPHAYITGNTFSIKDVMKRHGFRWFPAKKAWGMPEDDFRVVGQKWMGDAIRVLSRTAPPPAAEEGGEAVFSAMSPPEFLRFLDEVVDRDMEANEWYDGEVSAAEVKRRYMRTLRNMSPSEQQEAWENWQAGGLPVPRRAA